MTSKPPAIIARPAGLIAGAASGFVAGILFKQAWRLVSGDDDAPDSSDIERGWGEVLAAAALQGAIFAVVKAAVDRAVSAGLAGDDD